MNRPLVRRASVVLLGASMIVPASAAAQTKKPALPAKQPSTAPAQPAADPADLAAAKRSFETGLRLYKEGLFREALAAFLEAKKHMARESIQRNIAQCYRELKDFARAYEAYDELLAQFGAKMKPKDVDVVKAALEDLRFLSGAIRIGVTEPGAKVVVDDRDVGETPLAKPVRANLGVHKVTVTKAGFAPLEKSVEVKANEETVVSGPLAPEVQTGHVVVVIDGEPATKLVVDGKEQDATFPAQLDLPPGAHEIAARGQDAESAVAKVDVTKGGSSQVALKVVSTKATVVVEAPVADAVIKLDGAEVGRGAWEGKVPAGAHEIAIEAKGYETLRRPIVATAGQTSTVRDLQLVRLPPPPPPPHDFRGVYAQLDLLGMIAPAKNKWAESCTTGTFDATCSTSPGLGGGLGLRVGYSFGWLGLEGFVHGAYDRSTASVTQQYDVTRTQSPDFQGVARNESYVFQRFGAAAGAAVRATSMTQVVRVTAGAGGGVAIRKMSYTRDATATSPLDSADATDTFSSDTAGYTSPMAIFDAGILVGSTPGVKFHLGGFAMLDFLSSDLSANGSTSQTLGTYGPKHASPIDRPLTTPSKYVLGTPVLTMASGTYASFGVVLGLQFGE